MNEQSEQKRKTKRSEDDENENDDDDCHVCCVAHAPLLLHSSLYLRRQQGLDMRHMAGRHVDVESQHDRPGQSAAKGWKRGACQPEEQPEYEHERRLGRKKDEHENENQNENEE